MTIEQIKPIDKTITIGRNGKKIYPPGAIFVVMKYYRSKKTGLPIGFLSQHPYTHRWKGVAEDYPENKVICIVDAPIAPNIVLGMPYRSVLVPMSVKKGYVAIEAEPYEFEAKIEVHHIPRAMYMVDVKFGNRAIRFDPKDGRHESMNTPDGCIKAIMKRTDIKDVNNVIEEFRKAANGIIDLMKKDGFSYQPQKSKAPQKA